MSSINNLHLYPYLFQPQSSPPITAEWGQLLVPENRRKVDSQMISLTFVRFRCTSQYPGTPIVFLQGGPGISLLNNLPRLWDIPMLRPPLDIADFIFVEQRGVGQSRPTLDCPGTYDIPLDEPGSADLYLEAHRVYLSNAVSFWGEAGVDISSYNAREMAADIDDLRQALGYTQLSLLGGSFGSHHGLAILRFYGQHIQRALLWSVEGPNHTMKLPSNIQSHLELLNDLLKEDITLNRRVPDLLDLMASILEKLESRPVTVETIHPESDDAVEVTLGKYDLQLATATGLGKTAFLRALPSRYLTMAAGDYSWLGEQVIQLRLGQKSSLMYETTDYASGATVARREQIAQEAPTTLLGDAINEPFHQLGDVLGDIDLGDNFRGRLVCEVPALLVCGTLDVRTPISNAQELLPDLAKGQLLTIDGVSHDLAYRGDHIEKLTNIRDQFLRGEPVNYEQLSSPFVFQSIENNVH